MKNIRKLIYLITLLISSHTTQSYAEVINVPLAVPSSSEFASTLTMFWQAASPKATLILIPGGAGHIGLRADMNDLKGQYYQTLKRLSDKELTKGLINVIIFDNPYDLPPNPSGYPSLRASEDHLARIASVVEFYKKKTGSPIFLMGHSNGAVSVTEFLRYSAAHNQNNVINGLILSSSRNGAHLDDPFKIKTLVAHHEKDGCAISTTENSENLYTTIKGLNKSATVFKNLTTGEAESGNPCSSGFHMYNGAGTEAAKIIEDFILSK